MVSNDFTFAQKLFGVRTESLPGVPLASIPAFGLSLCDFSGSVAILAQAIADSIGHHSSPRPEDFRAMSLPVGVPSFPTRSRYQRRAERLARMTTPSKLHELVASPPAKAAACGLSAHPANASFVVPRPSSNPLANASSSALVAGATKGPAKRPNAASAYAKRRPFVVPARMDSASSVAQPGLACLLPSVLPTLDGRTTACEVGSLDPGTQALWVPAATAAKAAIAAVAACAPSMQAHTAATASATAVFIVEAHEQDSLLHLRRQQLQQQRSQRGVTRPRTCASLCGCGYIGCHDCYPSGGLFQNRRKVTRRA